MSAAPLVLAVPSKGRLQENAIAFFRRAGRRRWRFPATAPWTAPRGREAQRSSGVSAEPVEPERDADGRTRLPRAQPAEDAVIAPAAGDGASIRAGGIVQFEDHAGV